LIGHCFGAAPDRLRHDDDFGGGSGFQLDWALFLARHGIGCVRAVAESVGTRQRAWDRERAPRDLDWALFFART
jgi:hypothetical protein